MTEDEQLFDPIEELEPPEGSLDDLDEEGEDFKEDELKDFHIEGEEGEGDTY